MFTTYPAEKSKSVHSENGAPPAINSAPEQSVIVQETSDWNEPPSLETVIPSPKYSQEYSQEPSSSVASAL